MTDLQKKEFQDLVSKVELNAVFLKETSFNAAVPPENITTNNTSLEMNYSFGHQFSDPPEFLFCFVKSKVDGRAKPEASFSKLLNDRIVVSGDCMFVAKYKIAHPNYSKEVLQFFSSNNALFNTYPYIREHFHSVLSRMGINGVILPLLKPQVPETAVAKEK